MKKNDKLFLRSIIANYDKKDIGTHFLNVNLLFLQPYNVPNIKMTLIFSCGGGCRYRLGMAPTSSLYRELPI